MKNIKTILLTTIAIMLSTSLLYAASAKIADPAPQITLGVIQLSKSVDISKLSEGSVKMNPDNTIKLVNINKFSKGKVTVLIYMQTSCAACRKELEALNNMLAYVPDLNVIAISVDAGSQKRIKKYIDHYKFPFTFLHDPSFTTPELFGFSYTPASVLLDKSAKIIFIKSGWSNRGREKRMLKIIQDAMKK